MSDLNLPEGLSSRVLTDDDAQAVYDVAAAQEQADIGKTEIELADIISDWGRPSWDIATHTIGVFDGARMVGYGEITGHDRGDAAVHPDYRRRGIGTAIAGWMQQTVQDLGGPGYGSPVPEGSPGDRLLEKLGYRVRWHSWVLDLPEGKEIQDRPLPEGYALRAAEPEDYPKVHDVIEDAFLEWSERDRQSYADFEASVIGRPGFEPWCLRVVTDAGGEIVGTAWVIMSAGPGDGGLHAGARRTPGPAAPGSGPGAAGRRVRPRSGTRRAAIQPVDRLPHRRARPLREGRHGGRRRAG